MQILELEESADNEEVFKMVNEMFLSVEKTIVIKDKNIFTLYAQTVVI